jgi:dTMP kinase
VVFVTFEGIEGSGKSSLAAACAAALVARGERPVLTREPGGTPLGDAIRSIFIDPTMTVDPTAEAFLVNASRAQLVHDVIAPALKRGETILCDRFFDATLAYQGFGRGLEIELLLRLSLAATNNLSPKITFLLDCPVEIAFGRVRERYAQTGASLDRLERAGAEFHSRVRDGYRELAARFDRIVVLDARNTPQTLLAECLAHIDRARALA